jgi:hypothetical protein
LFQGGTQPPAPLERRLTEPQLLAEHGAHIVGSPGAFEAGEGLQSDAELLLGGKKRIDPMFNQSVTDRFE